MTSTADRQTDWLARLGADSALGALIERIQRWPTEPAPPIGEDQSPPPPPRRVPVEGSWGSSTHLLAGLLARRTGRPVLLVVGHLDDADEAADDLALLGTIDAQVFPALEVMPGESNVSLDLLADRLAVVSRLLDDRAPQVLIAPIQALMQAVPTRQAIDGLITELRRGQTVDVDRLINWLADAGYERVDTIDQPGQFAVRGGIIDIFGPSDSPAVRVDLFGDEIDSLAEIDLDSMGSDRQLESIRLVGASAERVQNETRTTSLWSLLADSTLVMVHEMLEVSEQGRGYYERLTDARGIYPAHAVMQSLGRWPTVEVNQFASAEDRRSVIALPVGNMINFDDNAQRALGELAELALGRDDQPVHDVVVFCARDAEKQRLEQLLTEHEPEALGRIDMQTGYLFRGFTWAGRFGSMDRGDNRAPDHDRPLMLLPHHELFHRYQARRRVRRVSGGRGAEAFFDLDIGDYVVHADHGIALFRGLRSMKQKDGTEEEYLTLEFADKALLHVPASNIELVQKYVGGFSGRPPLNKLGGKRWSRQKEQVKEAVEQLARQLLQVQAARASQSGFAFPTDSPWTSQFEAEFPYEETEDQLTAMVQIKRDMTSARPMDRLICGDVGYGKTELAMRAAFKAVEAGKQVAVLCPTTVLCEQHERTFTQRMADFPVRVESISRFKTAARCREILEATLAGDVDILIGTHRLLSDDVGFADLGLLVVDEEQRFGVEHKNRLMRFRLTVDVLTLSATPIPRTLHMAMLGLRDISSLSTPPADRRAIVTEVVPYEKQRVRNAILRELNRGGQVFFVHNRVHNIQSVADDVQRLVPDARIIIGHGQMAPRELEKVMVQFVRGEADVLVCTTIIESGIDIPTANTMFIHDADHFGLAELHQLRGRVGRYKHRAYCYLLLPTTRTVSEVASRRLRAIEQFSMLGAGFKIAMRDMEIRGVGNLLGAEQSGHIATVGYQMYCRLLEEAAAELNRQTPPGQVQAHLQLGVAGHIPKPYIPSTPRRMDAYRRLHRCGSLHELDEVREDLVEAYGPLPEPAERLVELAELRVGLGQLEVEALKLKEQDLIFTTKNIRAVFERMEGAPGSVRLVDPPEDGKPGTVFYRPPGNYLDPPDTLLAVLRKLLVRPLREARKAAS